METQENNNVRESFVFYRSFRDAIKEVSDNDKLAIYEAISNYALDNTEPNLEGTQKALWVLIKPQLDANRQRYNDGKRGGAPKGSKNNPNGRRGKNKPTNQELTINKPKTNTNKPNVNVNVNDNVNVNVNGNVNNNAEDFTSPTLDDVCNYINEKQLNCDGQKFYHHYTANGWKVGVNPMNDWKAQLMVWHTENNGKDANKEPSRPY